MNSKILVLDGAVGTMLQNMHQNLYSGVSWMNAVLQKSPQSI